MRMQQLKRVGNSLVSRPGRVRVLGHGYDVEGLLGMRVVVGLRPHLVIPILHVM